MPFEGWLFIMHLVLHNLTSFRITNILKTAKINVTITKNTINELNWFLKFKNLNSKLWWDSEVSVTDELLISSFGKL